MIETDTVRLLRECDSGVKMGIDSIEEVFEETSGVVKATNKGGIVLNFDDENVFAMKEFANEGVETYFTSMEKIKFSHMVRPGDKLELHVELLMTKMGMYKFHGIAMVAGKKVAESTFTAVLQKVEQ